MTNEPLSQDLPPDDEPDIAWGPSRSRLQAQRNPPMESPVHRSSLLSGILQLFRDIVGAVYDRK